MGTECGTGLQRVGAGVGLGVTEGARFTQASLSEGAIVETRCLIRGALFPLPPSTNAYWGERIVFSQKHKRHMAMPYTTHEAKAYIKEMKERIDEMHCRFFSKAELEMTMVVCPRDARRQDISNRLKGFEDSLKEAGVFVDDCQVVAHHILRGPIIKLGRVALFLSEVRIDSEAILSRAVAVKYIAPGWEEPVIDVPGLTGTPQSGDLFQDEVRNETRVRHPSRRAIAGRRTRSVGGDT